MCLPITASSYVLKLGDKARSREVKLRNSMVEHRRTGSWSNSAEHIENALSGLISDVNQAWKSVLKANSRTKSRYESLRHLQAFKSPRFTDSAKYQSGRRALAFKCGQEGKDLQAARQSQFRTLMGLEQGSAAFLSREVLSGKETRATFKNFRRKFGESSACVSASHSKRPHITRQNSSRPSPAPSKRADINKYVLKRMEKMMHSNSLSKHALLLRSASNGLAGFTTASMASSPCSPVSAEKALKRVRFSETVSGRSSPIHLFPSFTVFPSP